MLTPNKKIILMLASEMPPAQLDLLEKMPELGVIAKLEIVKVSDSPAADSGPSDWQKLGEEIHQRYARADGFVVLHGPDNLLYAASAQSFIFGNLGKPVIFTGQLDGDIKNVQEFRANLINACQAATFQFGEVGLMFGNRLLRANQSMFDGGFTAPESGILGRIDFSIRLFDRVIRKNKGNVRFRNLAGKKLAIRGLSPLMAANDLAPQSGDGALLVKAEMIHALPKMIIAELEKIASRLPVIVWTENRQLEIKSKKICLVSNMTWESTATKLLALESETVPVKELMAKDLAGEIIG